jgi:hypothetical protein
MPSWALLFSLHVVFHFHASRIASTNRPPENHKYGSQNLSEDNERENRNPPAKTSTGEPHPRELYRHRKPAARITAALETDSGCVVCVTMGHAVRPEHKGGIEWRLVYQPIGKT